ncbi:S24 family peptidase [Shewanella glacialipiscicola]|uniref:S24 family peptidase n=1 Tax=Shewanella TaxID=22 RepID=UPI003D7A880F
MEIGQIIRKARIDLGLTMKVVEAKTGILASNQSKIELGENTSPGFYTIANLAKFYGLSMEGICRAISEDSSSSVIAAQAQKCLYLPVISWVQAGMWRESIQSHDDDCPVVPSPFKCSNNSYILNVSGDSMTAQHGSMQSFEEGSQIVVDPDVEATNKNYVIARISGTNDVTFKQLIIDGTQRYLKPINPQYPLLQIDQPIDICGVVIGKIQKIKT